MLVALISVSERGPRGSFLKALTYIFEIPQKHAGYTLRRVYFI